MNETDVSTEAGQPDAMRGDGNQPADLGYAPPNPGLGDSGDSEIPIGVDALTDEQKAKGQEAAAKSDGDGALDVSAIVSDGDDATADADVDADAEAGAAADEAGDDAPLRTDPEAQVAANTGQDA